MRRTKVSAKKKYKNKSLNVFYLLKGKARFRNLAYKIVNTFYQTKQGWIQNWTPVFESKTLGWVRNLA